MQKLEKYNCPKKSVNDFYSILFGVDGGFAGGGGLGGCSTIFIFAGAQKSSKGKLK